MKQFFAFMKKEIIQHLRTGRMFITIAMFCLFGIMNPAIAKLTPWMLQMVSKDLEQSGMQISNMEVNALTAWTQYYKNMPIALIIFIIMFGSILTAEYEKGTLIQVITKGMKRWGILASKFFVLFALWSLGSLICFVITWGYSEYFWDNGIVKHLVFTAFCFYLFGLWLITVIIPASVFFRWNGAALLCTGAVFFIAYLVTLFPKVKEFSPACLMNAMDFMTGAADINEYTFAIGITLLCIVLNVILSIFVFNRKAIS